MTRTQIPGLKPKVFIGSSSNALPMAIVDHLVNELNATFELHPWRRTITTGQYTLDGLLQEIDLVDAAIFLFAKDDPMELKGQSGYSARGNVLLEYGLFISRLGKDRVLILEEEGVDLPSDVLGVTTHRFSSDDDDDDTVWEAKVNSFVRKVRGQWNNIGACGDAGLGYAKTIHKESLELKRIAKILEDFASSEKSVSHAPIKFGSQSAPISAYTEALTRVEKRFWTTTFLSSGFWTDRQAEVLSANGEMLRRLRASGGQARRLFLLDQPASLVAQAYRDHRVLQRKLHRSEELERLRREHNSVKENIDEMVRQGFEVRVVFDDTEAIERLPKGLLRNPNDSELAIYDDFRVDVFEGGQHGLIHSVTSHSRFLRHFDLYLDGAVRYFEKLWLKAEPIESFVKALQEAVDSAAAMIDYESNWLAMYEYALPKEEEDIKTVEFRRVVEILREETDNNDPAAESRYLDVGTCTGRYPIGLRKLVSKNARIVGVDEDSDCVRFAQARVQQELPDDRNIEILRRNVVAHEVDIVGPFELITCMLGTLSHFGWDRNVRYEDSIQRALDRMSELLTDSGLLFLGTWSEYACESQNMLGIYRQEDRERLAAWTPNKTELSSRLRKAGLTMIGQAQVEQRLDLTWCRRAQRGGG